LRREDEPTEPTDAQSEDARYLATAMYSELRALANHYLSGERNNHTLQPTALVHEAYARLADSKNLVWNDRAHFFAMAARMMRRVLVDSARRFRSEKRGRELQVTFEEQLQGISQSILLTSLDEALERLHALDSRQATIVELRFFGGLSVEECARILEVSTRTVTGDWQMAKAWLYDHLKRDAAS